MLIFYRKVSTQLNKMNYKGSFPSDSSSDEFFSESIEPTLFYHKKLHHDNEAEIGTEKNLT